ncbi:hypothetical protein PMIN06_000640 [Paraphaeosphaeria minitans]
MASEMLEKIKALRKQCLDQMTKQQETCTQAKELRLELMGKLLNYYGDNAGSRNGPKQDQP